MGGEIVSAGLGLAMLATPAGWVFIIGSAFAVGYLAAKQGDKFGKAAAGLAYDTSTGINWF